MFKTLIKSTAVMGLALGATFVTPAERVEASGFFAKDCGGLNQKTCIHVLPSKHCSGDLVVKRQKGRNICVRPSSEGDKTGGCGGLNEVTCISVNPLRHCDKGLTVLRKPGRNICIKKADLKPGSDQCGGLNQLTCKSLIPAQWCDKGLSVKRQPGRNICIKKVTNKDRLEVAGTVIQELGNNNPLATLTECIASPGKLGDIKDAIKDRSNNGVNNVLRSCGANLTQLQDMGRMASLNNGQQAGSDRKFKTLSITVGASGAAIVAGSAGAGIMIELKEGPNSRWFFTGGIGGGPKAEVVGDVTVGLSRSEIPSSRVGFDHGIGAVASVTVGVGLSGGVEFEGNSLDFAGITFGAGAGGGIGGAIYKTGAIFPFKDY